MTGRAEAEGILRALAGCPDGRIDLAGAALALAALDRPRATLDPYRAHIAELTRDVADAAVAADGVAGRIDALNDVILGRHGYAGDTETYDDLRNANLMSVVDRRRGLPVALGILYIEVARGQGWGAAGLNFPSHFLIRLDHGGDRAIVDPFHGGNVCDAAALRELLKATVGVDAELDPGYYEAVDDRDVLIRLQNNIKVRHLAADDSARALAVTGTMLLFAPHRAALWREAGMLNARLGNMNAAIAALEEYRGRCGGDEARREAAAMIERLKTQIN